MATAQNICDNAQNAWLDHLSIGGGIAVAAIALAGGAAACVFFWRLLG